MNAITLIPIVSFWIIFGMIVLVMIQESTWFYKFSNTIKRFFICRKKGHDFQRAYHNMDVKNDKFRCTICRDYREDL